MYYRKSVLFFFIVALGASPVAPACAQPSGAAGPRPQNVILFIADGGGPASYTMARDFVRWREGREALAFDSLLTGSIRTFSTSSRVTDSAAGATAFSAGVKTYNGAIAVGPEKRPFATILEGAEAQGMATGLVVTSRLTHATPAAFAAHVPNRGMENEIADQLLGQGIEVLMGGGRRHFLPDTAEAPVAEKARLESARRPGLRGIRSDGRNLIAEARAAGYHVALGRAALMQAGETPLLGLFSMSHMAYDLDRDPERQPSLAEMTRKALDLLSTDPDGFFLMVEGSRIDHAAHGNDAAAHLRDVLAYEEAFAAALDFARREGNTLIVATSDHETGGLTLGRGGTYAWHPEVLAAVQASQGALVAAIEAEPEEAISTFERMTGLGSLSAEERGLLEEAVEEGNVYGAVTDIINRRARVGWTTTGHTAVDVNVYAYGPGRRHFVGNHDNTYIGRALAELMGLDLEALTRSLRQRTDTYNASSDKASSVEEK